MPAVRAPWLTDQQAFDVARAAGCLPEMGKTASGRRWHCRCACGWDPPNTRATANEGVSFIIFHMRSVAASIQGPARLNGSPGRVIDRGTPVAHSA